MLDAGSLRGAGEGVDTAYYLVHSMGRGSDREGFAERERRAAENFARMAREEGVERVVYLGGLGDERSEHLKSRAATAETLAEHGPPLVYFRAAMVIGAGSESYRTVRYLVERLPAMIAPAWLRNRTQPIAIDDVLEYLVQAAERPEAAGQEIQIGGPDVLTYAELLDLMADVLGKRRRPKLPVPLPDAAPLLALDRPGDARGRRRGAAADREPRERDGRDRPGAGEALRRAADARHALRCALGRTTALRVRAQASALRIERNDKVPFNARRSCFRRRGAARRHHGARPRRGVRHRARLAHEPDGRAGRARARGRGRARRGVGRVLPRRVHRCRRRVPEHDRSAARRRRSVRARGHRGAARGRRRRDRWQGRARRRAARLDRQAARRAAVAAARPLAASAAHLVHDRHRHGRGHARSRPARPRVPRAEGQGRRRRGPRAARGRARGGARRARSGWTPTRAGRSTPRATSCPS